MYMYLVILKEKKAPILTSILLLIAYLCYGDEDGVVGPGLNLHGLLPI